MSCTEAARKVLAPAYPASKATPGVTGTGQRGCGSCQSSRGEQGFSEVLRG